MLLGKQQAEEKARAETEVRQLIAVAAVNYSLFDSKSVM